MISLQDAPRGTYLRMDSLVIQCLGNRQVIMAMPNEKIKRGTVDYNMNLKPATREEFLDAVSKANHNNDWFSLLLAEACKKDLE